MKQTQDIMGMPVTVEIRDSEATSEIFNGVFSYFKYVDEKFSTYKSTSEISAINRGELDAAKWSQDMKEVFTLSAETKKMTGGYFDILRLDGKIDPSGLVKGWAIWNAAKILKLHDVKNFYVEAGGDIEVSGLNAQGAAWRVGIENPFKKSDAINNTIVKAVNLKNQGIATSGIYKRGCHIYDPVNKKSVGSDILSLTVVGPNVYEADRFATAAFAMGRSGIEFIEKLDGFEGYQIDEKGIALMTSGFANYTHA